MALSSPHAFSDQLVAYLVEECDYFGDLRALVSQILRKGIFSIAFLITLIHVLLLRTGRQDPHNKNRVRFSEIFERHFSHGDTRYVFHKRNITEYEPEDFATHGKLAEERFNTYIRDSGKTAFERLSDRQPAQLPRREPTPVLILPPQVGGTDVEWGLLYAGVMILVSYYRIPNSVCQRVGIDVPETPDAESTALSATLTEILRADKAAR